MSFFQPKNNQKEFLKKIKQQELEAERKRKQQQAVDRLAAVVRKFLSNRNHVAPIVREAEEKIQAIVIRRKEIEPQKYSRMMGNAVFKMPIILSPLSFVTFQTLQGYSNYVLKVITALTVEGDGNPIIKRILESDGVRTVELLKLVQFSIILSRTHLICQQFISQFILSALSNSFNFIEKILNETTISYLKQLIVSQSNQKYKQLFVNEILFKYLHCFAKILKPLELFLLLLNSPTLTYQTVQKICTLINQQGELHPEIKVFIQSRGIEDLHGLYESSIGFLKKLISTQLNAPLIKGIQIHYAVLESLHNGVFNEIRIKLEKRKMSVEDEDEIKEREAKIRRSTEYQSFLKIINLQFYFGPVLEVFKLVIYHHEESMLENLGMFYLLLEDIFRKSHTKIFRLLADISIITSLLNMVSQSDFTNMDFKKRSKQTIILQLFVTITFHRFIEMDDSQFVNPAISFEKPVLENVIATILKLIILLTNREIKNSLFEYSCKLINDIYQKVFRTKIIPLKIFERENLDSLLDQFYSTKKQKRVQSLLKNIPFGFSFEARIQKLREFIKSDKKNFNRNLGYDEQYDDDHTVEIRRGHQFNDAFHQLADREMRQKYRIIFINAQGVEEEGVDGGGIIKELINQIIKVAFDPVYGLFIETSNKQIIPNPHLNTQNTRLELEFIGKLVGKAIYENILIEPKFAGPFLNITIGKENSFQDLQFIDKALYKSLLEIKHTKQNIEIGEFTFSFDQTDATGKIKTIELKQNGKNILVTDENKLEFVMAYADYKVNRQFFQQAKLFKKGFTKIIQQQWLEMFNYEELNLMISGNSLSFNVLDLMQNTVYNQYNHQDLTIKHFWQVINEMSLQDKSLFLYYVTSCSRPPTLGFKQLKPKFCISKSSEGIDHLPTVHTCMNLLKLPDYKNKETLKEKLMYAIHAKAGFEVT